MIPGEVARAGGRRRAALQGPAAWTGPPLGRLSGWLATLGLLLCLAACAPDGGGGGQARPLVVATTGMLADTLRELAGDRAEVRGLMGPGVDPHLYKAGPSDVSALRGADLVVYHGLGLEGKMGQVLQALAREGKPVVAAGERIDRARILAPGGSEGHPDPHLWFDVKLWAALSEALVDALASMDPGGAPGYRERGQRWRAELEELDRWCVHELAQVPPARRILVTSHDAFGYFGRAYGFEVVGLQGLSTVNEAGLGDVSALIQLIRARRIPTLFVESSVSPKALERVARESGARVGRALFSDAMGAEGTPEGTYAGMIRWNVRAVVEGLR